MQKVLLIIGLIVITKCIAIAQPAGGMMRVYKSKDCTTWEKQGLILDSASSRAEDNPSGAHGDVIVVNNNA